MDFEALRAQFRKKMNDAGMNEQVIQRFEGYYSAFFFNRESWIGEDSIEPLGDDRVMSLDQNCAGDSLDASRILGRTAVIKLNGGLGTTMGLDIPKSLLYVKQDLTFLDIIVKNLLQLNADYGIHSPLLFMNSFATDTQTMQWLEKYPALFSEIPVRFLQHQYPKVDASTLAPASFPSNPRLEWNPPGHGEIFTALFTSGIIDILLDKGYRYAFVSNVDNLRATPDERIASCFAHSDAWFMMEVTRRSERDRKGGHLAVRKSDGKLLLREKAQCSERDWNRFIDISRHRFFNTNNIWIDLEKLGDRKNEFMSSQLPLIVNEKTVDPTDSSSASVYQLETAMGAAIGLFEDTVALEVDRQRFFPVKTNDDLQLLRSSHYILNDKYKLEG